MKYGVLFTTVAMLLAVSAALRSGWYLLLLWPALSFGVVALGYFRFGPRVYGKSEHGLLSPFNQLILLPYLIFLWCVWYAVRLVKREPAYNQLTENVIIGRRLMTHEVPKDIRHVIDLTCEFNEPKAMRLNFYHSMQILDGFVPSVDQLRAWAQIAARLSGKIYIHCAEGHGRTGLFAAVFLLQIGHCQTVDEALQFIKSKRPLVRLGRRQLKVLREFHSAA